MAFGILYAHRCLAERGSKMGAWRRVIELSIDDVDLVKLTSIARSRTEPASRVDLPSHNNAYVFFGHTGGIGS